MRALAAAAAIFLACAGGAHAQDAPDGTLKKVAASGTVVIGFRQSSLPFSYLPGTKEPIGYAIDLCQEIVADMAHAAGRDRLDIRYVPVTSASRFEAVISGVVDLECGSTTANSERRKTVDFSPVDFVSATKLMTKRDGPVKSYRDLDGKTVVVTAGTTNEAAVKAIAERLKMKVNIVTAPEHPDSFRMVKDGKADAFATDDVLLYGLLATAGADGQGLTVLPAALSYEPYGIMFRKDDPQLAAVVTATFARLAESREIAWMYDRWFLKRLPNGERLNIPMSDELARFWQMQGLPTE